jgi:hypothetical protein
MRGAPSHHRPPHHSMLCLPPAAALLQPINTCMQQSEFRVARCELPQSARISSPDSRMTGTACPLTDVPSKKQQNCMRREHSVTSIRPKTTRKPVLATACPSQWSRSV